MSTTENENENERVAEPGPGGFLTAAFTMMALLVVVELFYRGSFVETKMLNGTNYITAKGLEYEKVSADIVVTGDSRMYHAINPAVMEETLRAVKGKTYTTFNYGVPSGTTPIFLMVAHEAIRHNPRPKVFILGVTPALFSCCDAVTAFGTQPGMRWSAVMSFLRAGWYIAPEEAGAAVFYGASSLMRTRTELHSTLNTFTPPPLITFHNRGYWSLGQRVAPATQDVRARGRAGAYAELMDKSKGCELRPMPGRYLSEAIYVLKRAGINVIVMGTPQARQLDWYHDEKHTYFEYIDEVKRVTAKHGVPFVDMNAPPVITNADFQDGDHLTEPGTTAFTKYVATEFVAGYLQ